MISNRQGLYRCSFPSARPTIRWGKSLCKLAKITTLNSSS
jgi:hypothetical protein